MEPYLLHLKNRYYIRAVARYRMSSHDLRIERGRYDRPVTPAEQRICTRCNLNEIDNEKHMLFTCIYFASEQTLFFFKCSKNIKFTKLDNAKFVEVICY